MAVESITYDDDGVEIARVEIVEGSSSNVKELVRQVADLNDIVDTLILDTLGGV